MEARKIHITDNIEALDEVVENIKSNLKSIKKIDTLTNSASTLYKALTSTPEDQEKTYIIARRYLMVLDQMYAVQLDKTFMIARYDTEIKKVESLVKKLREVLTERYVLMAAKKKKPEKTKKVPAVPKKVPEVAKKVPEEEDITEKPEDVSKYKLFSDNFISCKQLFDSMTDLNNLLLVDIRPEPEFRSSRIIYDSLINIPEEYIRPGLSGNTLGQYLSKETQTIWQKRELFSALVLIDWSSEASQYCTGKVDQLRNILVEWDFNKQYNQDPVILNGGFKEFIETYPTLVDNSHIYLVRKNDELDELLEIDVVPYPDTDSNTSTDTKTEIKTPEMSPKETQTPFFEDIKGPGPSGVLPETKTPLDLKVLDKSPDLDISDTKKADTKGDKTDKDGGYDELGAIKKVMEASRLSELQKARQLKPQPIIEKPVPKFDRDTKPYYSTRGSSHAGYVGLVNIRNTCYMNTVVQCVRCIPIMKELFATDRYKRYQRKSTHMLEETSFLIKKLWTNASSTSFSPLDFYNLICDLEPIYKRGNHEDCMEFFLFFLNALIDDSFIELIKFHGLTPSEQAFYNQLQGRQSIFIELFYHQIRTQRACDFCNTSTFNFETDNTIMLPVSSTDCTLDDLINDYFEDYSINDYCCSKCKRPLRNRKTLVREPKIFVIVLKRYYQCEQDEMAKNNVRVSFKTDNFVVERSRYKLFSIAMHQGTLVAGHYTAGCLINNRWVECNDERVSFMNIDSSRTKSLVCAFFYTRR